MINSILVASVILLTAVSSVQGNKFKDWLAAILGLNSRFYVAASAARGKQPQLRGQELVQYSLKTKEETVIWKAGGLCSPTKVGPAEIAILRHAETGDSEDDAGLWVVPLHEGKPRLALSDNSLLVIFGPIRDSSGNEGESGRDLLVLKGGSDGQKRIVEVNIDTKRVVERKDVPDKSLNLVEQLPHSSAFLNLRYVYSQPPKWELQIRDFGPNASKYDMLLIPNGDGQKRLEPIWIDDETVCYVRILESEK